MTIPSQIRYVHYYGLAQQHPVKAVPYLITHVRLVTVPRFDSKMTGGGCDPYFKVNILQRAKHTDTSAADMEYNEPTIYNYAKHVKKLKNFTADMPYADLDCSAHNLKVR